MQRTLGRSFEQIQIPLQILLPSETRQLIATRSPSAQVLFFVVYALVNKLVKFEQLSSSDDEGAVEADAVDVLVSAAFVSVAAALEVAVVEAVEAAAGGGRWSWVSKSTSPG